MTDSEHPHVALVNRAMALWLAGDLERFMGMYTSDPVFRVPGNNPFSGVYRGRDEIVGMFARLGEWTGGSLRVHLTDVLADDRYAFVSATVAASRDSRSLDAEGVIAFKITPRGELSETWFLYNDQAAYDSFFG